MVSTIYCGIFGNRGTVNKTHEEKREIVVGRGTKQSVQRIKNETNISARTSVFRLFVGVPAPNRRQHIRVRRGANTKVRRRRKSSGIREPHIE